MKLYFFVELINIWPSWPWPSLKIRGALFFGSYEVIDLSESRFRELVGIDDERGYTLRSQFSQ